jgi:hypothetical protein
MYWIMLVAFVLLQSALLPGDLNLPDIHPDETAEETFDKRFSFSNALESIQRVVTAMRNPYALSVEERSIGCRNWVGSIEGTLRKQQLIINQLSYELIVERQKDGKASPEDVRQAKEAMNEQKRLFVEFWEQFSIAD